ncbi:MAG: hypothetical protein OEW11_04315 [Nitrospirota bacterium]|nr:hypothetical protein [Nitrospirota bacterium]
MDAPEAPEYNRWVTLPAGEDPATRWRCWERMRRDDAQYSMGLVVHYNLGPVRPGAGSAIFMHVWRAAGDSTAGCTAMNPEGMQEVLAWLDPALRPVLLQGPLSALSLLATPPLPGAPGGSGDDST